MRLEDNKEFYRLMGFQIALNQWLEEHETQR